MSSGSRVAVVTIVHGRRSHLEAQQRSLAAGSQVPDVYVVVAMGEPGLVGWSPPHGPRPDVVVLDADPAALPLAAARNAGVARARELGAEVLILLDVDCLAGRDLVAGYAADVDASSHLGAGTVWSGPVTYLAPAGPSGYPVEDPEALVALDAPHAARPAPEVGEHRTASDAEWSLFWSLSFALTSVDWDRAGGFCELYRGYGGEDTDFAQSARSAGLRLGWTGTPRAYHQHHGVTGPPVHHAGDIVRNAGLFHRRWGWWPMEGWLTQLAELGVVRLGPGGWELA